MGEWRSGRSNRMASHARPGALAEPLECRWLLSVAVGGGWTEAGLSGAYYNNSSFSGTPAFSRRDVRIDFDWGSTIQPGGSLAPGFSDIGTDNYSIQWTGQLLPRFSEVYTFKALADDAFVLELKKSTDPDSAWTSVINQPTATGADSTGTFALQAAVPYDVRIRYQQFSGNAQVKLRWQSASTPEEVIDPLTVNGYLVDGRARFMFSDLQRQARTHWDGVAMDANGWPTGDGQLMIWEGASDPLYGGRYACQFTGRASVSVGASIGGVKFQVAGDAALYDRLASGQGWNSGTNTTTFTLIVPGGSSNNSPLAMIFSNTRRLASDTSATGITHLQVQRPRTVGGNDPYPFGTIYSDTFKAAADVFTSFRWLDTNGNIGEQQWADRVRPSYGRSVVSGDVYNDGKENKGWVYEDQIQFCNEMGKDLYLTVPMRASDDYFAKLGQLLKYGSDANGNPYTSAVANPVYPPLNPNLRAYVELSNEVWNVAGGFEQTRQADDDAVGAGLANSPEWNAINYDETLNTSDSGGWGNVNESRATRWYALRTIRLSEQLRSVFGDSQMISRIRPLLYWQYNNTVMAADELKFLDSYFNNGDGLSHVATPHPLKYFLWGAGGASYYSSTNIPGTMGNDPITNGGFDANGLPLGQASVRPAVSGWSFSGNAGIYGKGGSSYSSDGLSLGALPDPLSGNYAAYLTRGGRISQTINIAQSGTYALGFAARTWSEFPIDILVNGQRVTPQYRTYESNGEVAPASGAAAIGFAWNRNMGAGWVDQLSSAVFTVSTPGAVTIEISSPAANTGNGDYLLLDHLYLGSVSAIFDGGLPSSGYQDMSFWRRERQEIAQYAQAYGLVAASYESGWSVGFDGANPLQNYAKYLDPRAQAANDTAIAVHDQAGYGLVSYGIFEQWRDYAVADAASSQLRQSFAAENDQLPELPSNGVAVGGGGPLTTLTAGNQTLSLRLNGTGTGVVNPGRWEFHHDSGGSLNAQEWMGWNLLVSTPGIYSFSATTGGGSGGNVQLIVKGAVIASGPSGASGSSLTGSVYLTPGINAVRLKASGGSFSVNSVTVNQNATGVAGSPIGVSSDSGAESGLRVFASPGQQLQSSWAPYDAGFLGGSRVACGDLTGDGNEDWIVGTGPGAAHVKVLDGVTGQIISGPLGSFLVYPGPGNTPEDPNSDYYRLAFTGGVFVASGDIDGDGRDDLVTAADAGAGPHVKVYSGRTGDLIGSFWAYDQGFQGGVRIAAGDVNGDGFDDIITGAGSAGPHVRAFSGKDSSLLVNYFAYNVGYQQGITVAAGDVNGDGRAEIITGTSVGPPHVKVFDITDFWAPPIMASFYAFDTSFVGGVRVASGDTNGDGRSDIIVGSGIGAAHVRVFDLTDFHNPPLLESFLAYDGFTGGVWVAGAA